MPGRTHAVYENRLVPSPSTGPSVSDIVVGSAAWLEWLTSPEVTSFRYEHAAGGFTARRERRKGGEYWYAYRKHAGRLHKAYLGVSGELDLERLNRTALRLAQRSAGQPTPDRQLLRFANVADERAHGNLPAQRTTFVGREHALATLKDLLKTTRLLVLTGTGGVGKTRLALRLAATLADAYRDGIWWVDLAPLSDPELVPHQVATTVRIREQAGRDVVATLEEALRARQLLLVLDNCEHLVASCAAVVDRLLSACPEVRVLATSREVLGLDGETIWRVPPLSLPQSAAVDQLRTSSEAVELFVQRAVASDARFQLVDENAQSVVRICAHVDGIPLALELAAARLRTLSVHDIAERIGDRFHLLSAGSRTAMARHRTLRAMVDWSHELLSDSERALFARLSVFAGGWTLEAAEAVCSDARVLSSEVVDLLGRLVEKSLVQLEPAPGNHGRYRLLETLREYASEKLGNGPDADALHERHATFFLELAESLEPQESTSEGHAWREQLEREHDDLRAALRWFIDHNQVDSAQRLGATLDRIWMWHVVEGRTRLLELIALPGRGVPLRTRAKLCICTGELLSVAAEYSGAETLLREGLALSRRVADPVLLARALSRLAILIWYKRDFKSACELAQEGVTVSQRAGNAVLAAFSLWVLAQSSHDLGDDEAAHATGEKVLAISSRIGYTQVAALALTTLGQICFRRGELANARRLLTRSVQQHHSGNQPLGWLWSLANLGWVVLEQGDLVQAGTLFLEALAIGHDALGGGARLAIPLEGFAELAVAAGLHERGLRLAGAAAVLRETYATPPASTERWQLDRWLKRARAAVGEHTATAAWEAGRALEPEQAVAEATSLMTATRSPAQRDIHKRLTRRELEIATVVGEGLSTHEIAERLVITEGTVRVHVERILAKLGLHSRAQLAAWAVRQPG
jgi:predicted ATPase/DNA-binding CsgD family transcriptional regulator